MSESDAPPSYYESLAIPEYQPLSAINKIAVVRPPTSNINVAETSLMDFATSNCLHQRTRIKTRYKQSAYIWAFLLFCVGGVICGIFPFVLEDMKIEDEYCQQCKRLISSTPKKTENAHFCLTVIFFGGLVGSIFLVLFTLNVVSGGSHY